MMLASDQTPAGSAAVLQFRMFGPDSGGPAQPDLRRLFRGQRMTAARRARLGESGRILAMGGTRVVGLAAYERTEREVRVTELGFDLDSAYGADQIADGLLDALELACMASGARRLVLLPRATVAEALLRRRGYKALSAGISGRWFEKNFV
ncbi:MAG: hypothetical protein WCP29_05880 [Acidobacteriota bacterium]